MSLLARGLSLISVGQAFVLSPDCGTRPRSCRTNQSAIPQNEFNAAARSTAIFEIIFSIGDSMLLHFVYIKELWRMQYSMERVKVAQNDSRQTRAGGPLKVFNFREKELQTSESLEL